MLRAVTRQLLLSCILLVSLNYTSVAQVREALDSNLHAACIRATQKLTATPDSGSSHDSMYGLSACGVSGPPLVAALWDSIGPSSMPLLRALERTSRRFRDTRILVALDRVARDPGRGREFRFAALRILMSYLEPTLEVHPGQLQSLDGPIWSASPHFSPEPTDSPLTSNAAAAIGVIFRDLSNDPELGAAIQYLRQEAASANPSGVALAPQAIKLHYLCGNRFRIRNKENIAITVGYEVQETGEEKMIPVEARPAQGPPSETIFTTRTRGTVDLIYNNEILTSERNKGKECK